MRRRAQRGAAVVAFCGVCCLCFSFRLSSSGSVAPHRLAMAVSRPPLRLLIFGDSLTDGWVSFQSGPGEGIAPHLQSALADCSVAAEVTARGQAGRTAGEASGPLAQELRTCSYDAVLIFLEANDLLLEVMSVGGLPSQQTSDATVDALKSLHSVVRVSGSRSVALGLLQHPMLSLISGGHAALEAFNTRVENVVGADLFIDTARILPTSSEIWSSDNFHLQRVGYAELGRRLAQPLANFLRVDQGGKL